MKAGAASRRRIARPDRSDPHQPLLDIAAAFLRERAGRAGLTVADEIEGLSRARVRTLSARKEPAVAFLDPALARGAPATADLVGAVAALRGRLVWRRPEAAALGWRVAGRTAWAEIVGPEAPVPSDRLRLGLHLQGPRTLYPWHAHAAEEMYVTLGGTAWWGRSGDWAERPDPPGAVRRHAGGEAHAIETRPDPLLALYVWWGAGAAAGAEGYRLLDPATEGFPERPV